MGKLLEIPATTFNDYIIVPGTAPVELRPDSRDPKYYDISTTLGGLTLKTPIISANMTTVTGNKNAVVNFCKAGILPVLDQFSPINTRLHIVHEALDTQLDTHEFPYANIDNDGRLMLAVAVGFENSLEHSTTLIRAGVSGIVFDSANGYTRGFQERSKNIADVIKKVKDSSIGDKVVVFAAGNIATPNGVEELAKAGAGVIKVGIGPGAGCGTGPEIGTHIPQMTALYECSEVAHELGVQIIGDGGIKKPIDMNKALVFAHAIMMGRTLAATMESSAEKHNISGTFYANYRGSSSNEDRRERNRSNGKMSKRYEEVAPEGYDGLVPVEGSVDEVVEKYMVTLTRAMHYVGVNNLDDYRKYGVLRRVSEAARDELKGKVNRDVLKGVK